MADRSTEIEVLAQELERIGHNLDALQARVAELEMVIPRLQTAAETTARALEEVSSHWDAVYRAMRRTD